MNEGDKKIEFWAQHAAMWHDKYKGVMQIEIDCHRYKVALQRILDATNSASKERIKMIAQRALDESNG